MPSKPKRKSANRVGLTILIWGGALLVVLLLFVVGLFLDVGIFTPAKRIADVAIERVEDERAEQEAEVARWKVASDSVKDGDVTVRVVGMVTGKATYGDESTKVKTDEDWLQITVEVQNASDTKKVDFHGWGCSSSYGEDDITLIDDLGNSYRRRSGGSYLVDGQTRLESIYPGKSLRDVVLFEPPVAKAKELRMRLTGYNVGMDSDDLRFKFPKP